MFKLEKKCIYNYRIEGRKLFSYLRRGIEVPVVRAIPLWICGTLTSVAGARRRVQGFAAPRPSPRTVGGALGTRPRLESGTTRLT